MSDVVRAAGAAGRRRPAAAPSEPAAETESTGERAPVRGLDRYLNRAKGRYRPEDRLWDRHHDPDQERLPDAAPPQWHRGMTLIGVISLFIGTRAVWTHAMAARPPVAAVISVCYAGMLVTGILALILRTRRALVRVDLAVLVMAITLTLCSYSMAHVGGDEGVLTSQAAAEFLRGHPVYGQPWPWLFQGTNIAITPTMSGGADYTYGYPPLTVLLSAPVYAVIHSSSAATMVATGALIAGTVALWALLPVPWRSAATAVCLGFGMLPSYARLGYPAITAFALLVPVVVRWTRTGAGGRLGRYGVLRAVCLGLACAAQQLPWFLAPFLAAGIYCVRRGELGHRGALAVVARYTGLAVLTWLAANAYFMVQDFKGWIAGVALPLTQGAILHGQGVVDISYYFTNGSDSVDFYSYGSTLLLLGLLAALVLFIKRLGPALTVLPWCAFFLATRSQDGYYLLMTPLWLAVAATVPASALAGAWQPRIPRVRGRGPRAVLAAACVVPALACVTVAAAASPPLAFRIGEVHPAHGAIRRLVFEATNTGDTAIQPHFATSTGQGTSGFWTTVSGPATLAPHRTARYIVTAPDGVYHLPHTHHLRMRLRAFSDGPQTVSSADIPVVVPAQ
jgi:hypothetical protein